MGIKKGVFRKVEAGGKFKSDGCIDQNVINWNYDDGNGYGYGYGYNASQVGRAVDTEGRAAEEINLEQLLDEILERG